MQKDSLCRENLFFLTKNKKQAVYNKRHTKTESAGGKEVTEHLYFLRGYLSASESADGLYRFIRC